MTRYGVHVRNRSDGDFVWFTTTQPLQPGRYHLGREQHATVYPADNIASLMLMVGPVIAQAEAKAQVSFDVSNLPTGARQKPADDLTTGLMRLLDETRYVWVKDPPRIHSLCWAGPSGGYPPKRNAYRRTTRMSLVHSGGQSMSASSNGHRLRYRCIAALAATCTLIVTSFASAADDDLQTKLDRLEKLVEQQQADLDAQRRQLAAQYELIRQLQSGAVAAVNSDTTTTAAGPSPEESGTSERSDTGTAEAGDVADVLTESPESGALVGQTAAAEELERQQEGGEQKQVNAEATLYEPSSSVYDPDFPGAWHLPGTTAAMRIGGYVNLTVVDSLDPMVTSDRFIVGSIPPEGVVVPGARAGAEVTANQTRMNFEVRQLTAAGQLRAFVEGDFLAPNDAFRLRHAYGQYLWGLAGKTWSVFSNVDALPEEVDFEGINGAVLVRQPQLRVFPTIGKGLSLVFSIEDPTTDIANGTGSKGSPDFVLSVDHVPLLRLGSWNYKVSAILRDLEGQAVASEDPGALPTDGATGWGITTSGRKSLSGDADDRIVLWQLTYGEGIGRFINDLGTIGGGDAVFDPSGRLRALPVFAGFVSYRHTWPNRLKVMSGWTGLLRSNFTLSWVDVDTYGFQPDDAYRSTLRASANLMYFPTQNVKLGAELLWGERVNKDRSKGTATQVQISARYSF